MIFSRFRRSLRPDTISALYGMIVAQARLPCFYREYGVADTVNGRFDLIVLHLSMLLDRLTQQPALRGLGQGIFDRFCQDMDQNLREMGVGDLSVPREMQRMGEAFYGRARAYKEALRDDHEAVLVQALERNVYGGAKVPAAPRLAAYMREAVRHLAAQDTSAIAEGILSFPDPIKGFKAAD